MFEVDPIDSYRIMIRLTLAFTILTIFSTITSCNHFNNKTETNTSSKNEAQKISLLASYPLLTWAGKTPVEIGCMLEKEFSYRDSVFNCDYKDYINNGDPCKNTVKYYEGIDFPDELAPKIDPLIKEIILYFEHGDLRLIEITFKDSLLKTQIMEKFNLPLARKEFPDNVMDIDYGENVYSKEKPINQNYTKWLTITGFEHMGAGDVDCN